MRERIVLPCLVVWSIAACDVSETPALAKHGLIPQFVVSSEPAAAVSSGVSAAPPPEHDPHCVPKTYTYDADGITKVTLKASEAREAKVITGSVGEKIRIDCTLYGSTRGYHSSDPDWKQATPTEWGLDWSSERFGSRLVISTVKELGYMHHYYAVRDIVIRVPPGVSVFKLPIELGRY